MLRPGQILYTYLHLAPDPEQTAALVKSGAVCIAYETITGPGGGLPLLAPMSEVAGRMAVQAGAAHLEKSKGGMGVLLGGVPGVPAAHVVIHRRRRGRHPRAADGRGHGRAGDGARQERGPSARSGPGVWQPHQHRSIPLRTASKRRCWTRIW